MIKVKQELIIAITQNIDARLLLCETILNGNINMHKDELHIQIKEIQERIERIRILLKDIHMLND